jgi:hypothetical protein
MVNDSEDYLIMDEGEEEIGEGLNFDFLMFS